MKPNSNNSLYKETKDILNENGLSLNKNLGQNYLIDDFKRKKIIEFGKITNKDTVLEIGPGIGTLTLEIAKQAKKVIAIEQDKKILQVLKSRIQEENIDNIELIHGDAVKVDFPEFNKIISNLPYQISSPITFKFLEYPFDLAILMYQKEFVDRMIAKPKTKNYSRLSAMLYFKGKIELLDKVSPESFIPKPKVNSSIVKLTPKPNEDICDGKIDLDIINNQYRKVCKALFQHKNKKVRNALVDSRHEIGYTDKNELKSILNEYSKNFPIINSYLNQRAISLNPCEILDMVKLLQSEIK